MGIHNSVMDIHLGGIFALGFSYQYVFISSISADTRRKYCHFRRNSVKFNNDFIIALRVRWDKTTWPLRPRLHYIKHTVDWLYCSGCWFHLGSAYLHIINSLHWDPVSDQNRRFLCLSFRRDRRESIWNWFWFWICWAPTHIESFTRQLALRSNER